MGHVGSSCIRNRAGHLWHCRREEEVAAWRDPELLARSCERSDHRGGCGPGGRRARLRRGARRLVGAARRRGRPDRGLGRRVPSGQAPWASTRPRSALKSVRRTAGGAPSTGNVEVRCRRGRTAARAGGGDGDDEDERGAGRLDALAQRHRRAVGGVAVVDRVDVAAHPAVRIVVAHDGRDVVDELRAGDREPEHRGAQRRADDHGVVVGTVAREGVGLDDVAVVLDPDRRR